MAYVAPRYRCPTCKLLYKKYKDASRCRNTHLVTEEWWAVGKGGKEVRIFENHAPHSRHGIKGALRAADLSDFIEERKRQLEEEKQ